MTLLLVDANNVAMRAIHAMARSGLSSSDGVATGPLLNFITTLSKHIKEERPRAVAVCWDGGRSERRVALSPEYKAHRQDAPQVIELVKHDVFSLAKRFCSLSGIYHVERRGFEADDLIAHYWLQRNRGERVVILSSDKDFLQLVGENTEQVRLSSSGAPTDRWNKQRILDEVGVEPRALPYAMALCGDASDNVIGVPRVGMKTAIKILDKYRDEPHWWDRVLEDPKVVEYASRAVNNLRLVDLRSGLDRDLRLPPIPSFQPTKPGDLAATELVDFLQQFQMQSILSRFSGDMLWS